VVRIIVVCGAGASSTFVAHRIRRAAAAGDGAEALDIALEFAGAVS